MISLKPKQLILIGASTGGPGLIERIIESIDGTINGTLIIALHMQSAQLESFAKRLNRINSNTVEFVTQETQLQQGRIYLLEDTSVLYEKSGMIFLQKQKPPLGFYHPTIDELFLSAANLKDVNISAYLLTGIGADGAKGMLELKNKGFDTIAQDEQTSIVYGMPKKAFEIGAAKNVMSIEKIIDDIRTKVENVFMVQKEA